MGAVNNCTVDISKCVFTVGKHIIQVVVRDEGSWRGFSLVVISDDKSDKDLHCEQLQLFNATKHGGSRLSCVWLWIWSQSVVHVDVHEG